ncbi:MAG: DNA repair protein RecO [Bacteroidales bacterium]
MIGKTEGIVLHSLKYGENSLIVRVFTREMGMQSYLVRGNRKSRSGSGHNLYQPLTLLHMVVYHKEGREGLHYIREVSCPQPYHSLPYDITKTTVGLFLSEVLTYALKNQDVSQPIFAFIKDSLLFLDQTEGRIADFHLLFMYKLSGYLGFYPRDNYDRTHCFFNIQEGMYQSKPDSTGNCLDATTSSHFHALAGLEYDTLEQSAIPKAYRKALLHHIIDYYRYHLEGLQEIRSHTVLETVLL